MLLLFLAAASSMSRMYFLFQPLISVGDTPRTTNKGSQGSLKPNTLSKMYLARDMSRIYVYGLQSSLHTCLVFILDNVGGL